jgi:hypothetical protein
LRVRQPDVGHALAGGQHELAVVVTALISRECGRRPARDSGQDIYPEQPNKDRIFRFRGA